MAISNLYHDRIEEVLGQKPAEETVESIVGDVLDNGREASMFRCRDRKNRCTAVAVSGLSFRVLSRGIFISPHLLFGIVVSLRAGRVQYMSAARSPDTRHASNPRYASPTLPVLYRPAQDVCFCPRLVAGGRFNVECLARRIVYSDVRESSSTASASSALHLQLYLLVYPTSDHAARVVLKRQSRYGPYRRHCGCVSEI